MSTGFTGCHPERSEGSAIGSRIGRRGDRPTVAPKLARAGGVEIATELASALLRQLALL
jgi:hypothetical protein